MNYRKIYEDLTSTRKKLFDKRAQERKDRLFFYECHHILPRSLGGGDELDNLVLLTFKEHFLAHLLLFKIYQKEKLVVETSKMWSSIALMASDNKYTGRCYDKRKNLYWRYYKPEHHPMYGGGKHSKAGLESISLARKNKMPVMDINTGEVIGSVNVNHPKVISGEWVHTSKGRKPSEKERKELSKRNTGLNNPNARTHVDKEFILNFIKDHENICFENNFLNKSKITQKFYEHSKGSWFHVMIKNRFGNMENFIREYNQKFNTNMNYNPYYRGFTSYKEREVFYWFSCDELQQTIKRKRIEDCPPGLTWYKGGMKYVIKNRTS